MESSPPPMPWFDPRLDMLKHDLQQMRMFVVEVLTALDGLTALYEELFAQDREIGEAECDKLEGLVSDFGEKLSELGRITDDLTADREED